MEDKAKEREHQLKMMKEKCDSDLQMKKYDMESEKMKQDLERELQRMNDESEREKRQMQNEQLKIIGNETDKTNKMMLDMKKQSDAADQRAQKEDNEMYEKNRQEMLRMNEESRKEHERAMEAEKKTIARIEQETKDERERSEKEYKERQKHLEKRENEMKQLHQQQIDEMNEKYKEAEKRRDEHGDAMIAILDTECEKMMEIQEKQKESFEKIMQNSERNHKEKMAILNKQLENVQQTHDKIAEEYRVKRKYLENQKAALDELKQIIVKREIGFVSGLRKTVDDHIANSQFDSRMDENKRTADRTLCYITDIKRINVKLEIITNEEMKKAELDTLSFTLTALNKHAELARMTAAEDMLSIGANLVDQDIVPIAKDDRCKNMIEDIIKQEDELEGIFENMPNASNAITEGADMLYDRANQEDPSINEQVEHMAIGGQTSANAQQKIGQNAPNDPASSRKQIKYTGNQPDSYLKRY